MPQRNLRLGGVFQRHSEEIIAAGKTLRELLACRSLGDLMEDVAWQEVEFVTSERNQGI